MRVTTGGVSPAVDAIQFYLFVLSAKVELIVGIRCCILPIRCIFVSCCATSGFDAWIRTWMLQLAHLCRSLQAKHSQSLHQLLQASFQQPNWATFSAAGNGRWRCRRGQEQGLESWPELPFGIESCGHRRTMTWRILTSCFKWKTMLARRKSRTVFTYTCCLATGGQDNSIQRQDS